MDDEWHSRIDHKPLIMPTKEKLANKKDTEAYSKWNRKIEEE